MKVALSPTDLINESREMNNCTCKNSGIIGGIRGVLYLPTTRLGPDLLWLQKLHNLNQYSKTAFSHHLVFPSSCNEMQ